jgi:hypothetical protein
MALKLKVEQRPVMTVSTEIDATSLTTVTPIGTTLRDILLATEMGGTSPALSRPAINLYIIYKV